MKTVGYINGLRDDNFEKVQLEAMLKMGIQEIHFEREYFYDKDKWKKGTTIEKISETIQVNDVLVIYELSCLNLSVIQLSELFLLLQKRNVQLKVLKTDSMLEEISGGILLTWF